MNLSQQSRIDAGEAGITVIGIAGGVGSGKSTVAAVLGRLGCLVIDADAQVKALLDTPSVREQLIEWWGDPVVGADGAVDRSAIASIVFNDETQRRRLEDLIHPLVIAQQHETIRNADPAVTPAVVLDVPLLFEAGMHHACDAVIFVEAPEADRLARVLEYRGWDATELDRRQRSQMDLEAKKAKSDFVVMNAGDRADLEEQVGSVFGRIQGGSKP